MAWSDAGERLEAMPIACTRCYFTISNCPSISTPAATAYRCRYQSLTAGSLIYDHVSTKPLRRRSDSSSKPGVNLSAHPAPQFVGCCHQCLSAYGVGPARFYNRDNDDEEAADCQDDRPRHKPEARCGLVPTNLHHGNTIHSRHIGPAAA